MAITLDLMEYADNAAAQLAYVTNVLNLSNADIDNEDMSDITDWTDDDGGTGDSSQATFDSKSCMRLFSGANTGSYARRRRDLGTFGTRTVFSFSLYCDAVGALATADDLEFNAENGVKRLRAHFGSDGLFIDSTEVGTDIVVQDTWQYWTLDVNWSAYTVDVYLNGILQGSGIAFVADPSYVDGIVQFIQYGITTTNRLSYVDWLKSGSVAINDPNFPILQSYSESTIKTQGSYSLKGIAAITGSLNKTLTCTIATPIDLTGQTQIKYWAYALRTGSNFKIGWRDSGLNVIEHTPNIITSNTGEEQTVDISGVSNANKDVIDRIIITVLDADAANIVYLDNMFSPQAFTKDFTDTITPSEVFSKGTARSFLETITPSEIINKGVTRLFSDTTTLTDTYSRQWNLTRLYTETVTLTEVATRAISIFLEDTATLIDSLTRSAGLHRTFTETITLSDIFTKALKWLRISHTASVWTKATKALSTWAKATKSTTTWTKKYG